MKPSPWPGPVKWPAAQTSAATWKVSRLPILNFSRSTYYDAAVIPATVGAAQAGKSVTKDPTLEEALDGSSYHRTPGPIVFFVEVGISLLEFFPVVFQTRVEGSVLGMTRPVGASEGHALPETLGGANLRGSKRITTSGSGVNSTLPGET